MTKPEPAPVKLIPNRKDTSELMAIAGSARDTFNNTLILSVIRSVWEQPEQTEADQTALFETALVAMTAFKPADEIEGMIAAQALAMHHAAMECSRRAMLANQPYECAQGFRKAAANASRTFSELLETLDRKRGKRSRQVVRVERVTVEPGAHAVVGVVQTRGEVDGREKIEGEPHAPPARLAQDAAVGAVLPPMRGKNPERVPVPSTGNAERPMPNARRRQHRPPN